MDTVLEALESCRITHLVGLPDNASAALFGSAPASHGIRLVTVTREGEAFALATGLWIGGAAPVVVVQSTGLLESGDALRGTATRAGIPLPIIVTARGHATVAAAAPGSDPDRVPLSRELLVRADVDSAALLVGRTLAAWGIPFARAQAGAPGRMAKAVADLVAQSHRHRGPVALLVEGALTIA